MPLKRRKEGRKEGREERRKEGGKEGGKEESEGRGVKNRVGMRPGTVTCDSQHTKQEKENDEKCIGILNRKRCCKPVETCVTTWSVQQRQLAI